MTMTDEEFSANMRTALIGLIPLWIAELAILPAESRYDRCAGDADNIAQNADRLLYPEGRRMQDSGVLNSVARGLALGAFQPGGVTLVRIHACVEPHEDCPGLNKSGSVPRKTGYVLLMSE